MALQRGFSPGQFRDNALGTVGPFTVTATIPSTTSGSVGTIAVTIPATLGLLAGDDLAVISPVTASVPIQVTVTSNVALQLSVCNTSGSTFNPGSVTYTLAGVRYNTAA